MTRIRNGPSTRLITAPGRRRTSTISLPMRARTATADLASDIDLVLGRGYTVVVLDEGGDDLLEAGAQLTDRGHLAVGLRHGLDDGRRRRPGVVHDRAEGPQAGLADVADAGIGREGRRVEGACGLHLDDLAAQGLAPQVP